MIWRGWNIRGWGRISYGLDPRQGGGVSLGLGRA